MQVPKPTLEQANGFDLLIWMGDGGDILTKSYTLMGEAILKGMFDEYTTGDVLEILVTPDEFSKEMPPTARVGYVDPRTNKVHKMEKKGLH